MNYTTLTNSNLIERLNDLLLEPRFEVRDQSERRRARLTAATLLLMFGTYAIGNLMRLVATGSGSWLVYALPANVLVGGAYLLSRTRYYLLSAWGALGALGLVVLGRLFVLQTPSNYEVFITLVWFLYFLYLAAIMLPLRHFLLYGFLFLVGIGLVMALSSDITSHQVMLPVALYLGSMVVLTWTVWVMERNSREMRENEDRFQALLAVVREAIVLHDGQRVLDVNDAFVRIFGRSADEVVGRPLREVVPPEVLEHATKEEEETIAWRHADGSVRYVEVAQQTTRYRGKLAFALRVNDVTAREQARRELERQHRFLVDVINAFDSPFYVLDAETYEIVLANRAATKDRITPGATCYAITHLRETPCDGLEHPCPLQRVKETREPYIVEHIHYHADGSPYYAEVHGYPLFDEQGRVRYMVEYSLDVTFRKQMQRKLQEAYEEAKRASEFKSRLLANISHDVRTPLGGIIGYAEMLREGVLDGEEKVQALDRIIRNAQTLLWFTEGILHQAELETGNVRVVPSHFVPHELLSVLEVLEDTATSKGVELRREVDARLPDMLYGDVFWLQRVVYNLVDNAVKFTDEGHVTVRLRHVDEDHWAIEVEDTGSGIPEEELDRIFEAFYRVDMSLTGQQKGSGLGLASVKQLVELMGGDVRVTSQVGRGSRFVVTLPYDQSKEEQAYDGEAAGTRG